MIKTMYALSAIAVVGTIGLMGIGAGAGAHVLLQGSVAVVYSAIFAMDV